MASRTESMQGTFGASQRPLCVREEKGIILAVTLLIMLLLTALGGALLTLSSAEIVQGRITQNRLQALNLAEAGETYARRALSLNLDLDNANGPDQTQVFDNGLKVELTEDRWNSTPELASLQTGAKGTVTIVRHGTDLDSAVITSTARLGHASKTIEVMVRRALDIPPGVKGAITARGPVATNGAITVDGRDHTITGTLISASGSFGIYTASTYIQGGSSKVGGTASATDYVPARPGNPAVINSNAPINSVASTPDEVMGYSAGTLKAMAQSGVNGSQYVTDPALLTLPLSGVTYVELPNGGIWEPAILGDGSGILVVHNNPGNAVIKNINPGGGPCSCFRGLVIADDIVHIHATITGAVVSLTQGPSMGNVIGNGNGKVLFSRAALRTGLSGAQKIWPIYSWREVK